MRGRALYTPLPLHIRANKPYEIESTTNSLHRFIHKHKKLSLVISFCFILLFILLASIRLDGDPTTEVSDNNILVDGIWDNEQELKGWRNFESKNNNQNHQNSNSLPRLKWTESWSNECLDEWIADGKLCESMKNNNAFSKEIIQVDVIQTWVNGQEPLNLLATWRKIIWERLGGNVPGSRGVTRWGDTVRNRKHFREHDELRYSLRSILASFSTSLRKIHLLTTDLPYGIIPSSSSKFDDSLSSLSDSDFSKHVGQIPEWLNTTIIDQSSTQLNLIHHSEFFESTLDERSNNGRKDWIHGSLPTFNSLAIESQFGNLVDVATDHALYMNDDVFLFQKLSAGDIGSPLTGPIFRIQNDLKVEGVVGAKVGEREGEWPSLRYSNYLLDLRFGMRPRHYLTHVGKTISLPLLREASQLWPEEFLETSQSRFRERPDIQELQMAFLQTHYIIERHREALLWSFFVARSDGDQDGSLSLAERRQMVKELGYYPYSESEDLEGYLPFRNSLEELKTTCEVTGLEVPLSTTLTFSSMDGYVAAPTYGRGKWPLASNQIQIVKEEEIAEERRKGIKPTKKQIKEQQRQAKKLKEQQLKNPQPLKKIPSINSKKLSSVCRFNGQICFGKDFLSPSKSISTNEIFKRVAFENYQCGDCAILLLLSANDGRPGLSNFLPDKPTSSSTQKDQPPLEALGLEKDYHSIDFAPFSPSPTSNIRQRALRLIQRYSYTVGESSAQFISMRGHLSLIKVLSPLNVNFAAALGEPVPKDLPPTFLTINDDVAAGLVDKKKLATVLHQFFNSVWFIKAPWEKEVDLVV